MIEREHGETTSEPPALREWKDDLEATETTRV
jgi:hypothetical protein